MPKTVDEILKGSAETYLERNSVYKDNYMKVGIIMDTLFPDGITLKTKDDFNSWHLFELLIVKITRYAHNFPEGGHQDSIHDAGVYCAMVEYADTFRKKD